MSQREGRDVTAFEPVPFQIVDTPEQLKAFTDPLRSRVLTLLCERTATNQQIAETLGEPQAKVLYHVRFLLTLGLVRLVETRIKGGNVEKYYRAVARMFGLRAEPDPELRAGLAEAEFEALRREVVASSRAWPDQRLLWEARIARITPERVDEFYGRLVELIAEYWGGPATPRKDAPDAPAMRFNAVVYRDPSPAAGAEQPGTTTDAPRPGSPTSRETGQEGPA